MKTINIKETLLLNGMKYEDEKRSGIILMNYSDLYKAIKCMLEDTVDLCAGNVSMLYREPNDCEDFRLLMPYEVDDKSILKTKKQIQ